MTDKGKYTILKRILKVIRIFVIFLLALFLLVQVIIMIPFVQNLLKNKAVSMLQQNLNCDVSVERVYLKFYKELHVSNVLISENKNDTLFYLNDFSVKIRLFPLLHHRIEIQKIGLKKSYGDFGRLMGHVSTEPSEKKEPAPSSADWQIKIEALDLESCFFEYRTASETGMELILDAGKARVELGFIKPDSVISIKSLEADNAKLKIREANENENQDDSTSNSPDIRIEKTVFSNLSYITTNPAEGFTEEISGKKIIITDLLIDSKNNLKSVDLLDLDNIFIGMKYLPMVDSLSKTKTTDDVPARKDIKQLVLKNVRVKQDKGTEPALSGHFDMNHIDFNELNGRVTDIILDTDIIQLKTDNFSGKEVNGLNIINLKTEIETLPEEFLVKQLQIKTSESDYNFSLRTNISPGNFSDIKDKNLQLEFSVDSKTWNDIDYFYPFLEKNDLLKKGFQNNSFSLNTKISGKTDDLTLDEFEIKYLDYTRISATGHFINIDNPEKREVEINLDNFRISRSDIEKSVKPFFPDSVISLPKTVAITGKLKGNSVSNKFSGKLNSDVGNIYIDASEITVKNALPVYKIDLKADLHDLNQVVHYEISRAKLNIGASLKGNDLYQSELSVNCLIDTIDYKDYPYTGYSFSGKLDHGLFNFDLASEDPNLVFNVGLKGKLQENNKTVNGTIDVSKANLNALHLKNEDLTLNGKLDFEANYVDEFNFGTKLNLESLDFHFADTLYQMHPAEIQLTSEKSATKFSLQSFFYNLNFDSEGSFENLMQGFSDLPDYLLTGQKTDATIHMLPDFRLKGHLDYPEAFARTFFPGIPSFKSFTIEGSYTSATDDFYLEMLLPGLKSGNVSSDSLLLRSWGSSGDLNVRSITFFNMNDVLKGKLDIGGNFSDSKLVTKIRYYDSFSGQYLCFNNLIQKENDDFLVHFIPDTLVFSYDNWQIDPKNKVVFGKDNIHISDFNLKSDNQKISILSGSSEKNGDIELQLTDFGMGSVENLLATDTLVRGNANADIRFKNIFESPEIEGKLGINNLNIYDFDIGNFDISSFSFNKDLIKYSLNVNGNYADVSSKGNWYMNKSEDNLEINLDINKIDLGELTYFLEDKIYDPKGEFTANINIRGTTDAPLYNGQLAFKNAGAGVKSLNEYFTLGDQPVTFSNSSVLFNDFKIVNKNGRSARVNGTVPIDPNSNGLADLHFVTDNMEILNVEKGTNDLYFGNLKVQTNIDVTGRRSDLEVEAVARIDKSTNLTYIFPQSLVLNDNKGIVTFDSYELDTVAPDLLKNEEEKLKLIGLAKLHSKVELDEGPRFRIFFDESGADYLDVVLKGDIDYNLINNISEMSGVLEIMEGTLKYALPMVAGKEYEIMPGSTINVANDLSNPYLNISASTIIRASAEKLISSYPRVLEFTVILKMSGELNNLKVDFDILPQTDDIFVSSKLAQLTPEERSINALNLLVRGSFAISVSGDDAGGSTAVSSNVDQFYTQQLNHLISENVHLVDLNFDVESFKNYTESGQSVMQRNYYYNVGKSFLNNRARVKYKGSLDFTSNSDEQTLNSQYVQSELNVEVDLNKKGNISALFFSKDKYGDIIEGKVIETGAGLKFKRDYYSLWDIFSFKKRKEERKKIEKEKSK